MRWSMYVDGLRKCLQIVRVTNDENKRIQGRMRLGSLGEHKQVNFVVWYHSQHYGCVDDFGPEVVVVDGRPQRISCDL